MRDCSLSYVSYVSFLSFLGSTSLQHWWLGHITSYETNKTELMLVDVTTMEHEVIYSISLTSCARNQTEKEHKLGTPDGITYRKTNDSSFEENCHLYILNKANKKSKTGSGRTMTIRTNNDRTTVLERSVINYWRLKLVLQMLLSYMYIQCTANILSKFKTSSCLSVCC